ncbi:hypothetical protein OsJ_32683 [Oryza sativa Japonica Group]|uniref:Uncharacterized protein n=2 Tax=Oryza sativa subsp. japonica TaxID=39947 RepID=A0A8J8YG07_ORYSJ|nr:expressed protein [Oryza sativa Japonica Group]EAZ17177.1 hypothetical protein OsJ_32683 [Oryza sativa Japonica Group]
MRFLLLLLPIAGLFLLLLVPISRLSGAAIEAAVTAAGGGSGKLVVLTDVAAGGSGVGGRSCGRGGRAGAVGKAAAGDEVQGRPAVGKVLRQERQERPAMGISRGRRSVWGSRGRGGGKRAAVPAVGPVEALRIRMGRRCRHA